MLALAYETELRTRDSLIKRLVAQNREARRLLERG
jgi:hypothetical protein